MGQDNSTLRLDWTASSAEDIEYYRVYALPAGTVNPGSDGGLTVNGSALGETKEIAFEYSNVNFEPGKEYLFAVTPVDAYGYENLTVVVWETMTPSPL